MKSQTNLSSFILGELKLAGWKSRDDNKWVKDGIAIHVVPAKLNKMYYLTTTKMSDTTATFITEQELISTINQ